jgi:hypothetical protein
MRSLISLLFLGVIVFIVAGWFLDWYDVSKVKSENGKSSFQIDLNNNKIKGDIHKGGEKLNETIENFRDDKSKNDKTQPTSSTTPNRTASTTGGWSPVPN